MRKSERISLLRQEFSEGRDGIKKGKRLTIIPLWARARGYSSMTSIEYFQGEACGIKIEFAADGQDLLLVVIKATNEVIFDSTVRQHTAPQGWN